MHKVNMLHGNINLVIALVISPLRKMSSIV